ncbi:MAG: TolC family protein, partial [Bacteroidales bacterium]|nr:TolC family protein [Bacteroidales bacterium]
MKLAHFTLILSILLTIQAQAQKMSLEQCMAYAVENNANVRIQSWNNDSNRADKAAAIASLAPSISANTQVTESFGRSIDPETNIYTTNANIGNSYSLTAQMPIFQGLRGINNIRLARFAELAGESKLQQQKDETAIAVMKAYYKVVYYAKCADICREQIET